MYERIAVKPILQDLISFYWVGQLQITPAEKFIHRDIARTTAQLIFHYEGSFGEMDHDGNVTKSPLFGVHGQTTLNKQYFCTSEKSGILGIKLSPVAIPLLFSIPAYELTNQTLEFNDLLGTEGAALTERLYTAKSARERVEIVSSFFEHRLRRAKDKHSVTRRVVQYIEHMKGDVATKDLVNKSCLSSRQFQRNFKELTGYTPQLYLKVVRFENVVRNRSAKFKTLTEVALASGYFDQAHFNHDFKLFTGLTPSKYFSSQFSSDR